MKSNFRTYGMLMLIFIISSCEYEKLEVQQVPENVSFSADIQPIFNNSCNASGCHSAGGIPPDLSKANAFLTLQDYVDTIAPLNSILYKRMTDKSNPMPQSGILSDYETGLVLNWIKAGALDN